VEVKPVLLSSIIVCVSANSPANSSPCVRVSSKAVTTPVASLITVWIAAIFSATFESSHFSKPRERAKSSRSSSVPLAFKLV
jgi:hypothetical protein